MKKPAPRPVGEILPSALPQIADRLLELNLRHAWPSLVGRDAARRSRPDAFSGGLLRVAVDNSPWLHELTLRAAELTQSVRASFPAVQALRFVLGAIPSESAGAPTKRQRPVALTAADHADIDAAAAAISDSVLADAARRLLVTARRFPRTQVASRGAV
jgi:hypothetical protein